MSINDKTQIGDQPWANLKRYTMGQDYINTFWFKKLDSEGRQILEECIQAQKNQGNMGPLAGNIVKNIKPAV